MSADGHWWFYRINDSSFPTIQEKFEEAARSAHSIREILVQDTSTEERFNLAYTEQASYHQPFDELAYELLSEAESSLPSWDDIIGLVAQPRVLPPFILYVGIGKGRFLQLPGFFGNILLHSSEIEGAMTAIFTALDIEWEEYFERAIPALAYGTSDGTSESRDLSKILNVLPEALRVAKESNTGLLALVSWGSP